MVMGLVVAWPLVGRGWLHWLDSMLGVDFKFRNGFIRSSCLYLGVMFFVELKEMPMSLTSPVVC